MYDWVCNNVNNSILRQDPHGNIAANLLRPLVGGEVAHRVENFVGTKSTSVSIKYKDETFNDFFAPLALPWPSVLSGRMRVSKIEFKSISTRRIRSSQTSLVKRYLSSRTHNKL